MPAFTQFAQLVDDINEEIGRDMSRTPNAITYAIQQAFLYHERNADFPHMQRTINFTIPKGVTEVNYSTGIAFDSIKRIDLIRFPYDIAASPGSNAPTSAYQKLHKFNPDEQLVPPEAITARPEGYWLDADLFLGLIAFGLLKFNCTSDAEYSATMIYYQFSNLVESTINGATTTHPFLTIAYDVIKWRSLINLTTKRRQPEAYGFFDAEWQKALPSLNTFAEGWAKTDTAFEYAEYMPDDQS